MELFIQLITDPGIWVPLAVLLVVLFVFATPLTGRLFAPWVPTRARDMERVAAAADLQPGQTLYEIGCGDARVCLYLAEKHPRAQIVGVELSPLLYLIARVRVLLSGKRNIDIRFGNALKQDFSAADVIYVFAVNNTIGPVFADKIMRELDTQARFVSYAFAFDTWRGSTEKLTDPDGPAIYIYQK